MSDNNEKPMGFSSLKPLDVDVIDEGLEELEDKKEEEGNDKEEILRKLEEENKQLKSNSDFSSALDKLGDKLTAPQKQQLQQQPLTKEQVAEMTKKIDKEFYDSGFSKTADEYFSRKIAPFLQTFASSSLEDRKELAKLKNPEWFDKYGSEIEEEVNKIPQQQRFADPKVYEKAAMKIRTKHLDEIIEEETEKRLESKFDEMLEKRGLKGNKEESKSSVGYSQVGVNAPPKKMNRKGLTVKEKAIANRKGIPEDMFMRLKYDDWD